MNFYLGQESKFVFILAVIIEAGIVLTGLGISIAIAISLIDTETANLAAIFVAMAPFIIMSFCEMAKIPVAIGLWYSRKSKIIYILFLLTVCVITFETMVNGFERNFALLSFEAKDQQIEKQSHLVHIEDNTLRIQEMLQSHQYRTNEYQQEIAANASIKEEKITSARQQIVNNSKALAKAVNAQASYNQRLEALNEERIGIIAELSLKKQQQLERLSQNSSNNNALLDEQIVALELKIQDARSQMQKQIDRAFFSTSKERIRKNRIDEIQNLQTQLNRLVDQKVTYVDRKSFSFDAIDRQYNLMIEAIEDKIANAKALQAENDKKIANLKRANARSFAQRSKSIDEEHTAIEEKINVKIENLDGEFKSNLAIAQQLKDENFALREKIRKIDNEIERLYLTNQIYRFSAFLDGVDHSSKINPDTVNLVAFIWFGSLAFMCAIIGPGLTLTSLHLKTFSNQQAHAS